MANSRYKNQEWLDRSFTTRDVIHSHENAFRYFGGIPDELAYDQYALILVSENGGNLILTQEFQAYKEERDLNIYMCRKADPESKWKIEIVVYFAREKYTNDTYAIIPAKHIDYQSNVIESKGTKLINQTPLEIIRNSCTHYWADYEGRRNAVIKHLKYKQKTPIPVSVKHKLCFFPTHAPTYMDTCWINRAHVNRWGRIEIDERTSENQTEILFNNWYRLELGISMHTLLNRWRGRLE